MAHFAFIFMIKNKTMSTKEQYWKFSLIAIIIGLGIILFKQITPFLGGLLGALTMSHTVSEIGTRKHKIASAVISRAEILRFIFRISVRCIICFLTRI